MARISQQDAAKTPSTNSNTKETLQSSRYTKAVKEFK